MSTRRLLPDERHMLTMLLSRPFHGRDELDEQARHLSVTGFSCECGCPSISLEVARDKARPAPVSGMVVDGVGVDADDNVVGVLLFVGEDGYLSQLEVYSAGGDIHGRPTSGTWGRPTIESFALAEWEEIGGGVRQLRNSPGLDTD